MTRRLLRPELCAFSCSCSRTVPHPLISISPRQLHISSRESRWRSVLPLLAHSSGITTRSIASYSSSTTTTTCWKCGKEIPSMNGKKVLFFCPCDKKVILPPTVTNYFSILECEPLRVDRDLIKKKHTQLQRELHPDKFGTKSETEKNYSAQQSALVNSAYATLSKPYSRGLYLMELHGVTISESDNYVASGDSGKYLDFLEEVMELRAEIHHLETSPNVDKTRVKYLWSRNEGQLQAYTREFEECYEKDDLEGAKEALSKMKYYVTNGEMLYPMLPDE